MLEIARKHEFFVGIDSDGCAFDTMELKHKECFIPNIINYFELQGVSKYARQAAEFVNLYSKSRGINRFPALIETLHLLRRRQEVRNRGMNVEIPTRLDAWIRSESKLGNPALKKAVEATGDAELKLALEWSEAVNRDVAKMVRGVAPFPFVREVLHRLQGKADVLVVSATPQAALTAEWEEHGLRSYVEAICGQESGTKKEILSNASKYPQNQVLMVGDAPGDQQAAVANGCLFFPILPDHEEQSWRTLFEEGLDHFFAGSFAGKYQQHLLEAFDRCLPEQPPWPLEPA